MQLLIKCWSYSGLLHHTVATYSPASAMIGQTVSNHHM